MSVSSVMAGIRRTAETEDEEESIIVEFNDAFKWNEEDSELRQSLRRSLVELCLSLPQEGSEAELLQIFERFKLEFLQKTTEVEFRINNINYMLSTCPFQWFKVEEVATQRQKPHAELRQDHMQFHVRSLAANSANPDFVIRAYVLPDRSDDQCKRLMRFVAACTVQARAITPFVSSVLRIYESAQFTYCVVSRTKFGSIAGIMRSLHTLQTGSSPPEDGTSSAGCALPPQYTLYFSACVLQALQFLNDKGITVNRLTTETVEVIWSQIPVLTDFLYASRCEPEEKHRLSRSLAEIPVPCSPDSWLAPELTEIDMDEAQHGRIDVWNFGTFVLMMSVGTEGFRHVKEKPHDHRGHVSQISTAVTMQPCSQMAAIRPCSLGVCSPDLLHLLSVTLASYPCHRPTFGIVESLSYFARVNFLNLHEQAAAHGLKLTDLLGLSHHASHTTQQSRTHVPSGSESSRRAHIKQMQMLEQLNDVDEILGRMGLQAVTVADMD